MVLKWTPFSHALNWEDEAVRVMSEKFGVNTEDTRRRLNELLAGSARIVVTGRISGVCRDPKDDFILECAESGGADPDRDGR